MSAHVPLVRDRFEVLDTLGEGGMGTVHRAYDRKRRHEVALKVLRKLGGAELYRFKQEFRALAEVVHPNLVMLYEFFGDSDTWMFSMELLAGVPFIEHVRPYLHLVRSSPATPTGPPAQARGDSRSDPQPTEVTRESLPSLESPSARAGRRGALLAAQPVPERLRSAALQLAEGVQALHRAGKLHRDLKPSNVLVEASGRVVVCDFGLVRELDTAGSAEGTESCGTPTYMSPEQVAGEPQDEASDWYSVGVMLFEALTGRPPFDGPIAVILPRKCAEEAPLPASFGTPVDEELARLASELLARQPGRRPGGDEIVARLRAINGLGADPRRRPETLVAADDEAQRQLFVGRDAELGVLRAAFADARERCVTVLMHGRSGMGKSTVVRQFLDEMADRTGAVVLAGRCYERETVPHSTLDAVVDALSRTLYEMPDEDVRELVPRELESLLRLFPVLRRVAAFDVPGAPAPSDPQELRLRAFGALRVLLTRLAARRPTVLFIDDMQWGDVDSGQFLLGLVHHPSAPWFLVIGTYRDEDVPTSPLARLLVTCGESGPGDVRYLPVGALPATSAHEHVRAYLGGRDGTGLADRIVAEAGGNPFFLAELARARDDAGEATVGEGGSRLAALVRRRWQKLEAPARHLLAAPASQP